jgi:hypothetical protein
MSALSRAIPIFTIVYSVLYALSFPYDLQLFMYYPAVAEFHIATQPPTLGPPINWYGWIATAAIGGIIASLAGWLVPERWTAKLATLSWLIPLGAMLFLTYLAKAWFI